MRIKNIRVLLFMYPIFYKLGGLFLFEKERLIHIVRSLFPYHVDKVEHLYNGSLSQIYTASHWLSRWTDAFATTMHACVPDGVYAIRVWNPTAYNFQNYLLSSSHICKACGIRSLGSWWTLSDFGMIQLLYAYVTTSANKQKILAILIDGKDVLPQLKHYVDSLSIPKNVTARDVCDLYYCLTEKELKKHEDKKVCIIDYDLNEVWYKNDEYLFDESSG